MADLRQRFGDVAGTASAVGIEVEYGVWDGTTQVDFREIIDDAVAHSQTAAVRETPGRYRLPDGTRLCCDGWYAELITPPEPQSARLPTRLSDAVFASRNWLLDAIAALSRRNGRAYQLSGYSTHLNVQSPVAAPLEIVAKRVAQSFGSLLILATNTKRSGGIFCRPRPGRLEIATDYLSGEPELRTAIIFALGSALATSSGSGAPVLAGKSLQRSPIRYGWLLTPEGVSPGFRREGRRAKVEIGGEVERHAISLQHLLERQWQAMRPHLAPWLSAEEIVLAESFVRGRRKMPFEGREPAAGAPVVRAWRGKLRSLALRHMACVLKPWTAGGWHLSPTLGEWDFVIQTARKGRRDLVVSLPRRLFGKWGDEEFGTALGRALSAYARVRGRARLKSIDDTRDVGIFGSVDRTALARGLEQRIATSPHTKPKKKQDSPLCAVVVTDDADIEIYIPQTIDPQRPLKPQEPPQNDRKLASGVWAHNGALDHQHLDHRVRGRGLDFQFMRYYRSALDYPGPLGRNWDHTYNIRVVPHQPPAVRPVPGGWAELFNPAERSGPLTFYHGTGRVTEHAFAGWELRQVQWCDATFEAVVTTYAQNDGEPFEIQRYAIVSGSPPEPLTEPIFYRIMYSGGARLLLNCHGHVVQIRDPHHNTMTFSYGPPFDPGTLYFVLTQIVDTVGRRYKLEYELIGGAPRLRTLTDSVGRTLRFDYDGLIQLQTVDLATGDAGTPRIRYGYVPGKPGLLATVTNPVEVAGGPGGPWLTNTYDADDRVIRQVVGTLQGPTKGGGVHTFDYAALPVLRHSDREGKQWRYRLKPQGLTQVVESLAYEDEVGTNGIVATKTLETTFEYDRHYHISRKVHPSGRSETFSHRNFNAIVRIGEELDDVLLRIAHHNDLGRDALMEQVHLPSSGSGSFKTTYEYEWLFGARTRIDAPGGTTVFKYDQGKCATPQYNGQPLEIRYPPQRLPTGGALAVTEQYDYAPGGAVKSIRDPDGVEHEWTIDAFGQVTRYIVGGQIREQFDYDPLGNVKVRRDSRNKAYSFNYDGRDLVRSTTDPLGHVTKTTRNLNDRRIRLEHDRVDDPTGISGIQPAASVHVVETFEFDILGNLLLHRETASGGKTGMRQWRSTYDREERVILSETPRAVAGVRGDAKTRTRYNVRGLVAEVTAAEGGPDAGTRRTYYTEDGQTALVVDAMGGRTLTRYDGFGRVVSEARPNGTVRHLEFTGAEMRREWVEGPLSTGPASLGGSAPVRILREVQFQVDASHRPIVRNVRIFRPAGRVSASSGAGGSSRELTWFTPAGRLLRRVDPVGNRTEFKHNTAGQLESTIMPGGNSVAYRYDGELISEVVTTVRPDPGVSGPLPPGPLVMRESRTYDDLGREILNRSSLGVSIEYAYDSAGNTRAKRAPVLQGQFAVSQYEYDAFNRCDRQSVDQVASLANPGGVAATTFKYDLNGNLETATDALGRSTTSTYDGRDLIVSINQPDQRPMTYERRLDGQVRRVLRTGGPTTTLDYTPSGAPSRIRHQGASSSIEQHFGYDGLDRLTWCTDSNGAGPNTVQLYRASDSLSRVLSERTIVPQQGFDKTIGYDHQPGLRTAIYPSGARVEHRIGNDGNCKSISMSSYGTIQTALHLGPGRPLEVDTPIEFTVAQPHQQFGLRLRVNERYDPQGRPNFRTLAISDTINSPVSPPFIGLNTQSERTLYEANGLPWRRDYGVITQPNVSVDQTFIYDGLSRVRLATEGEGPDWMNTDYDWDSLGRLREIEVNALKAGQAVNDNTTIQYLAGQRIDRRNTNGSPAGTTTWRFDSAGRLADCVETTPSRRRAFTYDDADRLKQVDVFDIGTFFTSQDTYGYLYDALGRVVSRSSPGGREFFIYDHSHPAEEYDGQQALVRRYVHNDRSQLVHYGMRDSNGTWRTFSPLVAADGSPWVLIETRPSVQSLPVPPGASAAAVTRSAYYREKLPLIREEQRWRPFEKGQVIAYDYSGGTASGSVVAASLLPMDTGGRRFFAEEALFVNGSRFYDPALRSFITPDSRGAWGHGMAYGNAYAYAGNNPAAMGDDGNVPAILVGLLVVAAIGFLVSGAIEVGRQTVQKFEGSRDSYGWKEIGWAAVIGGAFAPVLVFAPELAIPLIAYNIHSTLQQWENGQIGGWTVAYDALCMIVPFGIKGSRTAILGKGSLFGTARGLGPAASVAARGGRFRTVGISAIRLTRGLERVSTADLLAELGGVEREAKISPAELEAMKGDSVGHGQQGDVWKVRGHDDLVVKEFNNMSGATPESQVRQLYDMHAVLRAAKPGSEMAKGGVTRIQSIGRTTDGRGFLIAEFAKGTPVDGRVWGLTRAALDLHQALIKWNPSKWKSINYHQNVLLTEDGHFTVVDPG